MSVSIVDCHCHFRDQTDVGTPVPSDGPHWHYLPADLIEDIAPIRLDGLVHVETGAHRSEPWRETEWVTGQLEGSRISFAIIGHADLLANDLAATLEAHIAGGPMRGVRMRTADDFRQLSRMSPGDNVYTSAKLIDGLRTLSAFGLHCELQAPYTIASDIAALAETFGDTQFVLTHMGFPEADGAYDRWREQISPLRDHANVSIKFSAIQMLFGTELQKALDVLEMAFDIFSQDRLLFGTNLPVDHLRCDDFETSKAFVFHIQERYPDVSDRLLRRNARRLYRL